jgi:hypothetical protein
MMFPEGFFGDLIGLQTTLSFLGVFLESLEHSSMGNHQSKPFKSPVENCDRLVDRLTDAVKNYNGTKREQPGLVDLQKELSGKHGFLRDAVRSNSL